MSAIQATRSPGARSLRRRARTPIVTVLVLVLAASLSLVLAPSNATQAAVAGAELAPGEVDQNAGAFTTSVAVQVPAFHGIEPKLALAYSSSGVLIGR